MKILLITIFCVCMFCLLSWGFSGQFRLNDLKPTAILKTEVFCSTESPEIIALPEFFRTSTYHPGSAESKHIRKDVSSLTPQDSIVISLKKGIAVMKSRSKTDPTSWSYQAAIHGTLATPLLTGWNSCTHSSEFFLSWHRMYLYFFERIMRKASGDKNFALPYWDWSSPDERNIPLIFRQPGRTSLNPLFIKSRDSVMNKGGLLPKSTTQRDVLAAMETTTMLSADDSDDLPAFNNKIESVHGSIHVAVGGVGGLMHNIKTAAQDPIFWMHHCNIDHIWERWMREKNPVMPDKNDPWMTKSFSFFDENGKAVKMSGKDIVDIARQLDYKYDDVNIKPETTDKELPPPIVMSHAPTAPPIVVAVSTNVYLSADKNIITLSPTIKKDQVNLESGKFILVFEKIKLKGWANGVFEIYVNQNPNETPDSDNINYIGSVHFFGLNEENSNKESHHEKIKNQRFDATKAIRDYLKNNNGQLSDLKVTIYHRLPEFEDKSETQKLSVRATVGLVKLVKR